MKKEYDGDKFVKIDASEYKPVEPAPAK